MAPGKLNVDHQGWGCVGSVFTFKYYVEKTLVEEQVVRVGGDLAALPTHYLRYSVPLLPYAT